MGRTAESLSAEYENKTVTVGSIDVHTGAGNFLSGVTPNQDIVAVTSGDGDGGSGDCWGEFVGVGNERFSRLELLRLAQLPRVVAWIVRFPSIRGFGRRKRFSGRSSPEA